MEGFPEDLKNEQTFNFFKDKVDDVAFNHNDTRNSTPITVSFQTKTARNFIFKFYRQDRTYHKAVITQTHPQRLYLIHERLRNKG